jgi:hypothetical protein
MEAKLLNSGRLIIPVNPKSNQDQIKILIIFLQFLKLILAIPFGLMLLTLGLIFSQQWLTNHLSSKIAIIMYSPINNTAFLKLTKLKILGFIGNFYYQAEMWWFVVIGLPLILGGISILALSLANFLESFAQPKNIKKAKYY